MGANLIKTDMHGCVNGSSNFKTLEKEKKLHLCKNPLLINRSLLKGVFVDIKLSLY